MTAKATIVSVMNTMTVTKRARFELWQGRKELLNTTPAVLVGSGAASAS